MNEDIELVCKECNKKFMWTSGEQKFMQRLKDDGKLDKRDAETEEIIEGKVIPPLRCRDCRNAKKARWNSTKLK